jgi:glycosyltransferase involved in cell wall biosynthesis
MRAVFVNEALGGHTTVHLNLRQALTELRDVDPLFYDVPAPGIGRKLAAAPIPGLARFDADLQPLRYQLAQSLVVRRAMPALLKGADVLHVYTHNTALLSTDLLRQVPSVVSLDGTNAQNAFRLPYRRPTRFTSVALRAVMPLERRVYEAATLVVTHSAWAAASVRAYGVDADRIRVIPFGVMVPDVLPPVRPADRPRLVFVGRSLARKGGSWLLELHQTQLRGRCDLDLVTMDDVPALPGVRPVRGIRPGDGRLLEVLRAARVFVFPSEMDLSPNAVLEAMAAGLPVVALDVGAVGEMVDHGVTGFLVRPGDGRALVAAIVALLDDPDLAARMGRAGRERARSRFDARLTTRALVAVLGEARQRHRVDVETDSSAGRPNGAQHWEEIR